MADFRKNQGTLSIIEERQFTNPHIRFVRINGRVVPILNKKRIGQTVSRTGNALITAGAVLSVLGGAPKAFQLIKKSRVKKILANPRTARIFNAARANATAFKHTRSTGLALSKFGKRSLIAGLALGVTGVVAGVVGLGIQTRSTLGADL